jgi:Zn-dependent protease
LLSIFFSLNLALGVFNLIPIPPLTAARCCKASLPSGFEAGFDALERFGYSLLMVAMLTGVFRRHI